MKQKYRFVGTDASIGDRPKLTKFGEVIELTADERKDAGDRMPLVHEVLFNKAGFTEQELSLYMYPAGRISAPDAFMRKVTAVWGMIGQEPGAPVQAVAEDKQ